MVVIIPNSCGWIINKLVILALHTRSTIEFPSYPYGEDGYEGDNSVEHGLVFDAQTVAQIEPVKCLLSSALVEFKYLP